MGRLRGKTALITGAASGMGACHARLFLEEGANVIIGDILEDAGKALAAECGGRAIYCRHDVADPASWESVLAAGRDAFGPVTVLVNNAGITGPQALTAELSREDYLRIVSVNMHGQFYGMQAVLPGMIKAGGGSIVNISSISGLVHAPGTPNAAYTATKFAIRGMVKAVAIEYAPLNIRVNSVHPGPVFTPLMEANTTEAQREAFAASVPIRRIAKPREISTLVLFLASDESSYVTGAEIVADGGIVAQ